VDILFGKLSWDAIPFREPVAMGGVLGMVFAGLAVLIGVTYFKKWGYLYREWLTSVDHKKLGIMYIVLALVMLLRGFADAAMMRTQQAIASGGSEGFLHPDHYNQIFTAHGVIMIFFMAMPFMVGLMNIVVPLQIGARDVAFPFVNSLSFWLTFSGAMLVNAVAGAGRIRAHRLAGVPAAVGAGVQPGRGGRLLHLGAADLGARNAADRRQLLRDHRQDARAGHDLDAPAHLHVDRAVHERPDHHGVPDPDRDAGDAGRRPLSRHALLHQ
jgi:hypothetical protein